MALGKPSCHIVLVDSFHKNSNEKHSCKILYLSHNLRRRNTVTSLIYFEYILGLYTPSYVFLRPSIELRCIERRGTKMTLSNQKPNLT